MPGLGSILRRFRRRSGPSLVLVRFEAEEAESLDLAEGTTDAVIDVLERVPDLDVVGPASSRAWPRSVEEEAGPAADLTVQGYVSTGLGSLRLQARLVRMPEGRELWRDSWERPPTELFSLQGELALAVLRALRAVVTAPEAETLDHHPLVHREPTTNLTAYRTYMEGRRLLLSARSVEELRTALERFEAAVEIDALFTDAWAGIAEAYRRGSESHLSLGATRPVSAMEAAAERALELDPSHLGANLTRAYADMRGWQLNEAERRLRDVVASHPGNAQGHRLLSTCLCYQGHFQEASGHAELSRRLEPLEPTTVNDSGRPLALLGRAEEAMSCARKAVRLDPEHVMTYLNLGVYARMAGRPTEAVTYFRAAAELSGSVPFLTGLLGLALVEAGDAHEAEDIATDLVRKAERGSSVATPLAALLVHLGRIDRAWPWFDVALERREPLLLLADTHWLPLPQIRDAPRFRALLEALPQPSAAGRRP